MHLDIPAGTAVRFEPGDEREVDLVAFGGEREVHGLNRLTEGGRRRRAERARSRGPRDGGYTTGALTMGRRISRREYAELFGPTTGDRVRLGDTDLWAEVERGPLVPGDECVFGGGKTLRDGLGTHGAITAAEGALDFVITNVLVIDAVAGHRQVPTSASRTAASPASARPATHRSWTASTRAWSSARTPTSARPRG